MQLPYSVFAVAIFASMMSAAVVSADECTCNVGDSTSKTFKCGNDIYLCPGVDRVCSTQESENSIYYALSQPECDAMQDVGLNQKCIPLPEYGLTDPKSLSNRVCYDNSENGFNGMKHDGVCEICKDTIPPPIGVQTIPPKTTDAPDATTDAPTDEETEPPTEGTDPPQSLAVPDCPQDITMLQTNGITAFPENNSGITILSQDTSTVTVELSQEWTDGNGSLDLIYYQFKEDSFSTKCYGEQNVIGGGTVYDTITLQCNMLTPIAMLEICVVDDTVEGSATIPQCCHSTAPPEATKVCYTFQINCDTECVDPEVSRRLLRGSK